MGLSPTMHTFSESPQNLVSMCFYITVYPLVYTLLYYYYKKYYLWTTRR